MSCLNPTQYQAIQFKTFPSIGSKNFTSKLTVTIYKEEYIFSNLPSFNKYISTIYDLQVQKSKRKNQLPKFKAILEKNYNGEKTAAKINNEYNVFKLAYGEEDIEKMKNPKISDNKSKH